MNVKLWSLACVLIIAGLAQGDLAIAQAKVLSDDELIEWVHDTQERHDWIYVTVHTSALLQRNPQPVRSNPTFRNQLSQLLVYAIRQLEGYKAAAEAANRQAVVGVGHEASVSSSDTLAPPRVDFPDWMVKKAAARKSRPN